MGGTASLIKCAVCDEKTSSVTHLFTFDKVSVAVCLSCRDKHAGKCDGCGVWRFKTMLMEQQYYCSNDECNCEDCGGIFCGFKTGSDTCNSSPPEQEIGSALVKDGGWAVGYAIDGEESYKREEVDEGKLTDQIVERARNGGKVGCSGQSIYREKTDNLTN